jgi:hypothetical protein
MLLPDDPETPQPRNEKLCWTRYRYCARSGETVFHGTLDIERRATLEQINMRMFDVLAMRAAMTGVPWNVFNMDLLLKAVE